jgi:hypothetical protein
MESAFSPETFLGVGTTSAPSIGVELPSETSVDQDRSCRSLRNFGRRWKFFCPDCGGRIFLRHIRKVWNFFYHDHEDSRFLRNVSKAHLFTVICSVTSQKPTTLWSFEYCHIVGCAELVCLPWEEICIALAVVSYLYRTNWRLPTMRSVFSKPVYSYD